MALETVEHINDLVQANPASTDPASQGDDHIRNIKKALKQSFAFIAGPVTASHTELSFVKGVTSAIQTQINNIVSRLSNAESVLGTLALGTVAPTRRVATGSGLSGGGDLSADRTLSVDNTVARTTTQVIAGDGLSGGGTLAANRTLEVDNTVVRTTRSVATGSGLTGGGNLGADRTLAVDGTVARNTSSETFKGNVTAEGQVLSNPDTGSASFLGRVAGTNAFQLLGTVAGNLILRAFTTTGTSKDMTLNPNTGVVTAEAFSGNLDASNLTGTIADARLPTTAVRTSRAINAGNGLTGGGNLTTDKSLAIGTPTSISRGGSNSVTATSHSHSLSDADFRDYAQATLRANQIGSMKVTVGTFNNVSDVPPASMTADGYTWSRVSHQNTPFTSGLNLQIVLWIRVA